MRLIPVWALRPGMEVAKRVSYGEGAPLLNAGTKLQPDYIRQLRKLGVRAVYIHDQLIPDVMVEDVILEETRERAISLVQSTIKDLKEGGKSSLSRLVVAKKELTGVVDEIINQLLSDKNFTVNLSDIRYTDNYTFSHSVNVAVLSMMTAISLKMNRSEIKTLGMGAFLHDLGKVLIPLQILNKPGRLTEKEMGEMKQHPYYGFDLVRSRHVFNGALLSVIFKHHERIDGSGYPQGLVEEDIDIFAKITAVADVYDALASDRPYRPGYMPHQAMEIIEAEASGYDMQVLQTFYHHIAAYPIGTFVGLNDGRIGVVVANTYGSPTRPKVRAICMKDSFEELQQTEMDLADTLNIVVDCVYSDHEIPAHIYYNKVD